MSLKGTSGTFRNYDIWGHFMLFKKLWSWQDLPNQMTVTDVAVCHGSSERFSRHARCRRMESVSHFALAKQEKRGGDHKLYSSKKSGHDHMIKIGICCMYACMIVVNLQMIYYIILSYTCFVAELNTVYTCILTPTRRVLSISLQLETYMTYSMLLQINQHWPVARRFAS